MSRNDTPDGEGVTVFGRCGLFLVARAGQGELTAVGARGLAGDERDADRPLPPALFRHLALSAAG